MAELNIQQFLTQYISLGALQETNGTLRRVQLNIILWSAYVRGMGTVKGINEEWWGTQELSTSEALTAPGRRGKG